MKIMPVFTKLMNFKIQDVSKNIKVESKVKEESTVNEWHNVALSHPKKDIPCLVRYVVTSKNETSFPTFLTFDNYKGAKGYIVASYNSCGEWKTNSPCINTNFEFNFKENVFCGRIIVTDWKEI